MTQPFIPRQHQTIITNYILDNPRCAIWSFMGSGKTAATLQALGILKLIEPAPVLVIGPLRVARNVWSDEIEQWAEFKHFTLSKILGSPKERLAALTQKADIHVINYENIEWLVTTLGDAWPFAIVIADEASRLKGLRSRQGTKCARYLAKVAHTKIKRFVQLTGTPASNGLQDLFACGWFIDGGKRLGKTFTAFSDRWFRTDYSGYGLIPLPHAQKEIEALLSDVCLSLKASDYFDLKEPIVNKLFVELPSEARKLYKDMERQLFVELNKHEVEAFNAASMTVKVLQIANGALYVDDKQTYEEIHDAKIEALKSVIEESGGAPVLVAYNFKSDLARLRRAFPRSVVLDTNPQTLKDWNTGKIPLLLAHPAAAGHGLSLQHGGNILAFFSLNWNLEEHLQIIERIGPTRQMQSGYDRPVYIHYIMAKNTIDEMVFERLETKKSVQEILLEALKAGR